MRRVPPSTVISEEIDRLLHGGVQRESNILSELAMLGVKYLTQQGLEQEQLDFLGRDRYERAGGEFRGHRNGYEDTRLKTAEGEVAVRVPRYATLHSRSAPKDAKWPRLLRLLPETQPRTRRRARVSRSSAVRLRARGPDTAGHLGILWRESLRTQAERASSRRPEARGWRAGPRSRPEDGCTSEVSRGSRTPGRSPNPKSGDR